VRTKGDGRLSRFRCAGGTTIASQGFSSVVSSYRRLVVRPKAVPAEGGRDKRLSAGAAHRQRTIRGVTEHRGQHQADKSGAPSAASANRPKAGDVRAAAPETRESNAATPTDEVQDGTDIKAIALTVLAVIAVILVLQYAKPVLIPIVIGVLISYVLGPLVDWLATRGISRWIGAALVLVLLCGALGYSTYKLAPQILSIVEDMPIATRRLLERTKLPRNPADEGAIEKMQRAASEIDKATAAAAEPAPTQRGVTRVQVIEPPFSASEYLRAGGKNVLGFLGQFSMVLFLVFFLLVTGDLFKRKLVKIAGPTLTKKKITVQIMDEINQQIAGFLRVQVLTSVLVGVLTGVALWGFGVRQYIIWGIFAGIFNSVPYLGPMIVAGAIGVVSFMQFDDLIKTGYICVITFAITALEGWLLTPALMSRASQMNPVAIFVGLLFWSWVWGVWGTILAVPMMMMVKAISDRVEDLQPVGELLGE
jgi:predicted PurR-regulated permease PerM